MAIITLALSVFVDSVLGFFTLFTILLVLGLGIIPLRALDKLTIITFIIIIGCLLYQDVSSLISNTHDLDLFFDIPEYITLVLFYTLAIILDLNIVTTNTTPKNTNFINNLSSLLAKPVNIFILVTTITLIFINAFLSSGFSYITILYLNLLYLLLEILFIQACFTILQPIYTNSKHPLIIKFSFLVILAIISILLLVLTKTNQLEAIDTESIENIKNNVLVSLVIVVAIIIPLATHLHLRSKRTNTNA